MITITVYGRPAPQGSKRAIVNRYTGKPAVVESSKNVRPWREAVKQAAMDARNGALPLDGPIVVRMVFTIARPKKPMFARPCAAPDLSKLVRSTEDALTDAGVWKDDSRVVDCHAVKFFVGDAEALEIPGAVIEVWSASEGRARIEKRLVTVPDSEIPF